MEKAPGDPDMYFEEKSLDLEKISPSLEPSFVDEIDASTAKKRDVVKQNLPCFPEDGHYLGTRVTSYSYESRHAREAASRLVRRVG